MEVSVVIPAMNEEDSIGICIEKVNKVFSEYNIDGEVVVADNSTDKTPEIARSLGAKVVTPDKKGYGAAYLYGFEHASGDYIVIADADNTYDFLEIMTFIEPLRKGEADFVMGTRLKGEIKKGAMPPLHQHIGNPGLTWILNKLFKSGISDSHCGMRAITKDALGRLNLNTRGMEFASEMIIEATRKKLRIAEVPITYYPRAGESKLSSFSDGWRHLKFMLLHSPSTLFIVPGLIMFMAGWALVIALLGGPVQMNGIWIHLHPMLYGSLLAILGYQIINLGLFAKTYAVVNNIEEHDAITEFVSDHVSLERAGTIGLIVFLIGAGVLGNIIYQWANAGSGALPEIRMDIFAMTLMVLGAQTVFAGFFLSIVGMKNNG